jgi:hypothetical protein
MQMRLCPLLVMLVVSGNLFAADIPVIQVEAQPLGGNITRLLEALEALGRPLPVKVSEQLAQAVKNRDAKRMQQLLDPFVQLVVSLNPESRVKVAAGTLKPVLQQAGYTPVLVKIANDSTVTSRLRISSPQSGPVYAGAAEFTMKRQDQVPLAKNQNVNKATDRFLDVAMYRRPPMTAELSGLKCEYALALIYSTESGQREATIGFDVGQGTQDIGFRGQVPVLFDIRPAIPVALQIRDVDDQPTTARLVFLDKDNRVYPPQPKRIAPDLFFQKQIYRSDGDQVVLPPGEFTVHYSRGPEYRVRTKTFTVQIASRNQQSLDLKLQRWVNPRAFGFFSGDHHIHAAGCAHYQVPTQGVLPRDMFQQVKGEGLNVGCVLTWGPCFDYQRQFFSASADQGSEPDTLLKYDLEISGFGSASLGHVCLLNLRNQTYPGTAGTTSGWPTWTTPVLRWAKQQGATTGYAHSASGLQIFPDLASTRLVSLLDQNSDQQLSTAESQAGLIPEPFEAADANGDGQLTIGELERSHSRSAMKLPNLAIPEMNGVGAMEICVTTALGLCDFISAMDTARTAEWNCWYHILNCGFPLRVSGETDFPCMSSTRVGQGRVYVQLGKDAKLDFGEWCKGIAAGHSYVSDGYAHALQFEVNGASAGDTINIAKPGRVKITAQVAFAHETPIGFAYGTIETMAKHLIGDTVNLHTKRSEDFAFGKPRTVELVVNGKQVASQEVPGDGQIHAIEFETEIAGSSWIAIRQFPQLHTNPVTVTVQGKPVRASANSARWCAETIRQLWRARKRNIAAHERNQAKATFDKAITIYERIEREARDSG